MSAILSEEPADENQIDVIDKMLKWCQFRILNSPTWCISLYTIHSSQWTHRAQGRKVSSS